MCGWIPERDDSVTVQELQTEKEMLVMRTIVTAIIFAMVLGGCAYVRPLPPEQLVIQKVVEVPNGSKEQLIYKSKIWFAKTFRQSMAGWWEQNSTRTVIQYESREKGMLIANGAILYPLTKLSDSYKKGWEVRFTLQEEVMDGKARITFSKLNMFIPTYICGTIYSGTVSSYEKGLDPEEYEKVKPIFNDLADQFGAFMLAPEKAW
jgi:Domain of unknown function (DUF4468) with TBP-like fold